MSFKKRAEKAKEIFVYIATPAYDGKVHCDYSQSLAEASWCAAMFGIRMVAGVMGNGAFIDLARNVFVKKFLEEYKDCTHLFFIDSDLKFQYNAMIGLLKADLPICAGVYPRRQTPIDFPFKGTENPDGGGLWFVDDWMQCDRVPTGFLCIRRDVVEEMAKDAPTYFVHGQGQIPNLFYTKVVDGKFIGEDYAFCDDYRKRYGKPIPVWSNFDFVHGGYEGNLFKHLVKTKQLQEEAEKASAA